MSGAPGPPDRVRTVARWATVIGAVLFAGSGAVGFVDSNHLGPDRFSPWLPAYRLVKSFAGFAFVGGGLLLAAGAVAQGVEAVLRRRG